MLARLPAMVNADGITKRGTTRFGGLDHNLGAGEGTLWDMENLTGDYAPLLAPRKQRYLVRTLSRPNGIFASDGLFFVDGPQLYAGDKPVGRVEDSRKSFAAMGAYIIVMPDKAYYNRLTGEFGHIEASFHGTATLRDGTIYGEEAKANTVYAKGAGWEDVFHVGDAVTFSGCAKHPGNNMTLVIREIEGDELRFYENSFTVSEGGDEEPMLTLTRSMPDVDFLFSNGNRLWGCKGDEIYASKLGDIFNWNVFDGLSTDSYAVTVGSAGDFTAACSYKGYPCFFKEETIYKVFGDEPSDFQVISSASLGVERGSGRSPAIAGEKLFYLSRTGIMSYAGMTPMPAYEAFGLDRFRDAVGGSDGVKYYVNMKDARGKYQLYVYDTNRGMWHREDQIEIVGFAWDTELYMLDAEGNVWLSGSTRTVPDGAVGEGDVRSMAEFGDFTDGDANIKGTGKLQIRIELEAMAEVKVLIQYDSSGVWEEVRTLRSHVKRSFYLPVIPRRADHMRIRLEGVGMWRLYSLVREAYSGSEMYKQRG